MAAIERTERVREPQSLLPVELRARNLGEQLADWQVQDLRATNPGQHARSEEDHEEPVGPSVRRLSIGPDVRGYDGAEVGANVVEIGCGRRSGHARDLRYMSSGGAI